jgi:hypothetical protein
MMNRLVNELHVNDLTLLVALPANSVKMAKAAQDNGAHAIKTHLNMVHRASKVEFGTLEQERDVLARIVQAVEIPVGVVPGASLDVAPEDVGKLGEMGFDFYDMFYNFIRPQLAAVPGISMMVAVDSSCDLPMICALGRPPVQMMEIAVIPSSGYGARLSIADLARYRQITEQLKVPAIIPSQRALGPKDVPYLYETGAKALMIGVLSTGTDPDELARQTAAFREAVERL